MTPRVENDLISLDESIALALATDTIVRARQCAAKNPAGIIGSRFSTVLSQIDDVQFSGKVEGSFDLQSRVLTLNPDPIDKIIRSVLGSLQDKDVPAENHFSIIQAVFTVYLFHELRHVEQGIGKYQTVKLLKKFAFAELIAELDLLADRDSAAAYAELNNTTGEYDEYLALFKSALYFSVDYFFNSFDFSQKRRPHKVLRAVGLIMMLGRLMAYDDIESQKSKSKTISDIPLDSAIVLRGMTPMGPYVLLAEQPTKRLAFIAAEGQADVIAQIIEAIEAKNFGLALAFAESIALEI